MTKRSPARPPDREGLPDFTPVPRKCKRHDGWTPARQKAFIDALSDTGSVTAAARAVGMSAEGAYHLRRQPGAEEFDAAWIAALEHRIEILRDTVMERAIHGVEVPVYSYGKLIGTRRVFNDRTALHMLRNYDGHMSAGAPGVPLRIQRLVDEHVAAARREWEAEQAREHEEAERLFCERMDRIRDLMAEEELMPGCQRMSRMEINMRIARIVTDVFAALPSPDLPPTGD